MTGPTTSHQGLLSVNKSPQNDSIFGEEEDQHNFHTQGDELMMADSRAAFAIHTPAIGKMIDPMTHKEAVKKYRMQHDPVMSDYARNLKKMGIQHMASKTNTKSSRTRGSSLGQDLSKYLGHRALPKKNKGLVDNYGATHSSAANIDDPRIRGARSIMTGEKELMI